ncbi:MAG: ATP-binding protein [Cyanophyceae cyanobacterium]
MSSYQESILRRAISKEQFEQLCCLWQQTAQSTQALLVTETELLTRGKNQRQERFRLLLGQQFSALLFGNQITEDDVYVSATFDPQAIANFSPLLEQQLGSSAGKRLERLHQARLAKPTEIISHFALQLLEILAPNTERPSTSVAQVVRQPLEQEPILDAFQNINGSIAKTVKQVRSLLQVDRVVIYQTDVELSEEADERRLVDAVTYEALASERIPSILHFQEEVCLSESPDCRDKYRQGFTLAVDDVHTDSRLGLCVQMLMQELRVRAKLVTPIVVQEKLWGLLIAHQCTARQWQPAEIQFLKNVADYLAIAIYQTQSYQQLHQQQQGLERQVVQQAQELKEARIVAQAANQSKNEFLSNISHEFRTPLTHVIGLSGTLMHWSKQGVSFPVHKQRQYLDKIHDSGKQLLALINNLLDLSQVKAGQSLLHISEFSLQQLARQVFQSVQPEAAAQNITLQLDLQVEPYQDRFWADPERVQQILGHLLDNAIKFTPAGNRVTLRVHREDEYAIFQVEDNGIGVAQEQVPLLFEAFQQLEHSRQRTHGGAGLGLSLTKELVDLHRGTVEVESTVGQGSLFTVRLPPQSSAEALPDKLKEDSTAVKGATGSSQANPSPNAGFRAQPQELCPDCSPQNTLAALSSGTEGRASRSQGVVVLVENDEEEASWIGKMLSANGYQMVWLTNGSTAAAQIQWLRPICVILSWQLPNVRHTIHTLKQLLTTSNTKVLLLTSSGAPGQQELFEELADDFIQKPIQPEQFLAKLSN